MVFICKLLIKLGLCQPTSERLDVIKVSQSISYLFKLYFFTAHNMIFIGNSLSRATARSFRRAGDFQGQRKFHTSVNKITQAFIISEVGSISDVGTHISMKIGT